MTTQQALSGHWNEIRGKLKQKWGKLTDDDLRSFDGNVDQLIGRIQRKTGETREGIEHYIEQLTQEGSGMASELRDRVESGVQQASAMAEQGYDALRQGYAEAERAVQERPGQAMAIAFGLGLVCGAAGVLMLRSEEPHESMMRRGRTASEHYGRQILDALSKLVPSRD